MHRFQRTLSRGKFFDTQFKTILVKTNATQVLPEAEYLVGPDRRLVGKDKPHFPIGFGDVGNPQGPGHNLQPHNIQESFHLFRQTPEAIPQLRFDVV